MGVSNGCTFDVHDSLGVGGGDLLYGVENTSGMKFTKDRRFRRGGSEGEEGSQHHHGGERDHV